MPRNAELALCHTQHPSCTQTCPAVTELPPDLCTALTLQHPHLPPQHPAPLYGAAALRHTRTAAGCQAVCRCWDKPSTATCCRSRSATSTAAEHCQCPGEQLLSRSLSPSHHPGTATYQQEPDAAVHACPGPKTELTALRSQVEPRTLSDSAHNGSWLWSDWLKQRHSVGKQTSVKGGKSLCYGLRAQENSSSWLKGCSQNLV